MTKVLKCPECGAGDDRIDYVIDGAVLYFQVDFTGGEIQPGKYIDHSDDSSGYLLCGACGKEGSVESDGPFVQEVDDAE